MKYTQPRILEVQRLCHATISAWRFACKLAHTFDRISALGGGLNRSRNTARKSIGWGFKAQGLSRALIKPQGNFVEVGLREAREVCSSWEVLPQQAIGVLVAAALPGAAWIAEVDLDIGRNGEALVVRELLASIPGQGAAQFARAASPA